MIQNILYKNIRNVLSHWEEKHYENNGVRKTKQNRSMLVSFCSLCGKKISRFIKNQEASGLLGKLVIKTLLCNIPND